MKKMFALVLASILMISVLSACGGGAASEESAAAPAAPASSAGAESTAEPAEGALSGEITFFTNRTDIVDSKLKDMVAEFEAANPGTKIHLESATEFEQNMLTWMAADEMPDIGPIIRTSVTPADYSTYFLPLDDLGFSEDNLYFYKDGLGDDGSLYCVTDCMYYEAVVYNKPLFEKAGIEAPPTTLEELYAACDKLLAVGATPICSAYTAQWTLRPWGSYATNAMAALDDPGYRNNLVNSETLFSDDGGLLASLDVLRGMVDKGYYEENIVSADWDTFLRDFVAGNVGMYYEGSWLAADRVYQGGMNEEDVGCFPFPTSKSLYSFGSWYWGIAKNSDNPELAKAFLKFMIEDGTYAKYQNLGPTWKADDTKLPGVEELLSFGLPIQEYPMASTEYTEILNHAQINMDALVQEYMITTDKDAFVEKYNSQWAAAREEVMGA